SLFHYGLDSLMLVEFMHAIEEEFGAVLPIESQSMTLAEIALKIGLVNKSSSINLEKERAEYPLSRGQQGLFFLQQLMPENPAYNISTAVRIRSKVDFELLKEAFQKIIDRHPTLRTSFFIKDAKPVQKIETNTQVGFEIIDAHFWTEAEFREKLNQEILMPFDLRKAPLLRVKIYSRSQEEQILLLVIHHIISDLWSLAILIGELASFYEAGLKKVEPKLSPQQLTYSDYIDWQEKQILGQEGEELWHYWKEKLSGELPTLNLPSDFPRGSVQSYLGASYSIEIDQVVTDKLKFLSRQHQTTLYTTLLSAFQILLKRYSGQDDLLIGSPVAGRSRAGLANLIGYFVNMLVIRVDLSTDLSFLHFLDINKKTVQEAFRHQHYPFELLVEKLQPTRTTALSPVFQAAFVMQQAPSFVPKEVVGFALGTPSSRIKLGELELESFPLEKQTSLFDLTFNIAEVSNRLIVEIQYNKELFTSRTASQIISNFKNLLESVAADSSKPISNLSIISSQEKAFLLQHSRKDFSGKQIVSREIERIARERGEKVAIECEGREMSYGQMNEMANKIGRYLKRRGVKRESIVGIQVGRREEMVVSMLGVMKAAGAYVAMEQDYPRQRIEKMVEESRMEYVIVEEGRREQVEWMGVEIIELMREE
ncbi:MAG: AMP-binding protein, partial [Blastocatellia bacterium]|nr:AMP-binding protein [Blastocatellia bacterium]